MKPNIHQYPEGAPAASLLPYKIAVMQAFADGRVLESRVKPAVFPFINTGVIRVDISADGQWHTWDGSPEFNWSVYDYRIMAPKAVVTPSRFFCDVSGLLFGRVLRSGATAPDSEQYCVEVRPDGSVCYLHLDGHRQETEFWTLTRALRKVADGYWAEFDGNMEACRSKPVIAEGHNPDRVTIAQVGMGYRLLTANEILGSKQPGVEYWDSRFEVWKTPSFLHDIHSARDTYRTAAKPGEYLPKKIAEGHNPDKFTVDQVGAGWRLLSVDENTALRTACDTTEGLEFWLAICSRWQAGAAGGLSRYTYRTQKPPGYYLPKPKVAEGHNPEGLTEAQVGVAEGYRLLSVAEAGRLRDPQFGHLTPQGLELWARDSWRHGLGALPQLSYRTKNPPGHYLTWPHFTPKPVPASVTKVAEGHNPARVTENQIPAGWRLLTADEAVPSKHFSGARFWCGNKWSAPGECVAFNVACGTLIVQKPVAATIASGHNPRGLTVEQVGDGYRLLDAEEKAAGLPAGTEFWSRSTQSWKPSCFVGHHGTLSTCYRIRRQPVSVKACPTAPVSSSAASGVPASVAAGHNPENLTAQQLEAEKGWRLLTTEEHAYLASLNASALTRDQLPLTGSDLQYRSSRIWSQAQGGRPPYTYRTKRPAGWYTHEQESNRAACRLIATIASGHNPTCLTEQEVGVSDGWRLLSRDEVMHRASQPYITPTRNIQMADAGPRGVWMSNPAHGNTLEYTYRTKLPAGHFLPRPKPTTVKGWLETLPAGYRERALRNLDRPDADTKVDSLSEALFKAFTWCTAPEGDTFWVAVHDWTENRKDCKLPKLPRT